MNDTSNTPDEQPDGRVATDGAAGAPSPRPSGESAGADTATGTLPSAGNGAGRHEGDAGPPAAGRGDEATGTLPSAANGAARREEPTGTLPSTGNGAGRPEGATGALPSGGPAPAAAGPRPGPAPAGAAAATPPAGPPTPARRPDPATPTAGMPSPARPPVPAPATPPVGTPAGGNGSGQARPASPRPGGGSAPRLVKNADDAPTTTLRAPFNGAGPDDETTVSVGSGRPSVPGPGPAAAGPPPWNRVPGQEPVGPDPVATRHDAEPVPSDLLDDGPTAFLEAPSRSDADRDDDKRPSGWSARGSRGRPPRQAALQLKRLDPWSVLKLALVLAVVLFLVWMVAIGVLYGVLDGIGVWDRLNGTYADLVSGSAAGGSPLISAGRVFALAAVVGAINSLLFAVAMTVGAFIYNVSADLVGGIEVTLSERD